MERSENFDLYWVRDLNVGALSPIQSLARALIRAADPTYSLSRTSVGPKRVREPSANRVYLHIAVGDVARR